MTYSKTLAAVALACGVSSLALAQHDDVILAMQNGQIITGEIHNGAFEENRLWTIDIDFGLTDEPGFEAPSGTFPGGSPVGITILKALRTWDYDEGHFLNIAEETMIISRFTLSAESPPNDPCPGDHPTLPLGVASGAGSLHLHPWYELTAPAADGMYLLELEFWMNPGVQPVLVKSKPFWIIYTKNEDDEKAIHEAEEWVIANKVEQPLPCPADLTGNGSVGVADLLVLLAAWGPNLCHAADLTGDGNVGVADLLVLLAAWGPCP